jgi:hypothetical protein
MIFRGSIALLLAVVACAVATRSAHPQQTRAFIAATDFMTGSLADITFGPPRVATSNVASISSDPALRWYDGLVYVINGFNHDNIQVLDPANDFNVARQFSVGNGSNPHDIEFVSPVKAYVTRYELDDLLIVNPMTGAPLDSISLAPFADADGIPEMDHLALRHGRLFVTLQRLDRNNSFQPAGGSQIVVIDVNTDAIVDVDTVTPGIQGLLLPAQNPFTELIVDPAGRLVVGCVGALGPLDGRVVRIDPVTLAVTTEITETALGGDINDVAILDAEDGFVVVSDASFNTSLKSYRRDLGTAQSLLTTSGFLLADIELNDRDELWLCDRSLGNPGVRIFDAVTRMQLTSSPIGTGLPPVDIQFDIAPSLVGVAPSAGSSRGAVSLAGIHPNPSRGSVHFAIVLGGAAAAGDLQVEIADVAGRIWWSKALPAQAAGTYSLRWDGDTREGKRTPAGIYFVRVRSAAGSATKRLVRID